MIAVSAEHESVTRQVIPLGFLVFRIFTKDYCIQLAKLQLDANRPKSPPPPISAFGEILGSYRST